MSLAAVILPLLLVVLCLFCSMLSVNSAKEDETTQKEKDDVFQQTESHLKSCPSVKFYSDVHRFLANNGLDTPEHQHKLKTLALFVIGRSVLEKFDKHLDVKSVDIDWSVPPTTVDDNNAVAGGGNATEMVDPDVVVKVILMYKGEEIPMDLTMKNKYRNKHDDQKLLNQFVEQTAQHHSTYRDYLLLHNSIHGPNKYELNVKDTDVQIYGGDGIFLHLTVIEHVPANITLSSTDDDKFISVVLRISIAQTRTDPFTVDVDHIFKIDTSKLAISAEIKSDSDIRDMKKKLEEYIVEHDSDLTTAKLNYSPVEDDERGVSTPSSSSDSSEHSDLSSRFDDCDDLPDPIEEFYDTVNERTIRHSDFKFSVVAPEHLEYYPNLKVRVDYPEVDGMEFYCFIVD
eukprot:GHVS01013192.1.p1 GENE.GHVS01013192.1~~GHVS01013192.1.p1  ORF type:complete len:400 (+),score=44.67 GHVS01013192.1:214-1413(+)